MCRRRNECVSAREGERYSIVEGVSEITVARAPHVFAPMMMVLKTYSCFDYLYVWSSTRPANAEAGMRDRCPTTPWFIYMRDVGWS